MANQPPVTLPLEQVTQLWQAAALAAKNAHAPYSGFTVGAALLLEDETVITGCNIEAPSYSLTLCAERVALFKALSEGHRQFKALAIWASPSAFNSVTPCGACREVIAQWLPAQAPVIWAHAATGVLQQTPVAQWLPHPFNVFL